MGKGAAPCSGGLEEGLRRAPSIRMPAVAYFQSAISSLRARATIIVLPRRPPLRLILPVQCSDPTLANREFKSAFRDGCDRNRVSGSFSKQLIRNRNGGKRGVRNSLRRGVRRSEPRRR